MYLHNPFKFFYVSLLLIGSQYVHSEENIKYIHKSEEFRKTVLIDTVAKVLNYTDGLPDEGEKYRSWYAYDTKKCIYRKFSDERNSLFGFEDKSKNDSIVNIPVNVIENEINLNSIDKNSLATKSLQIKYPSVLGEAPRVTTQVYLYADGREIFRTEGIDRDRVNKGWALIYSKYCIGAKKEF